MFVDKSWSFVSFPDNVWYTMSHLEIITFSALSKTLQAYLTPATPGIFISHVPEVKDEPEEDA